MVLVKVRSVRCPLALLALAAACGGNPTSPTAPEPRVESAALEPASWTISGRVLAGPDGAAIPGASLAFGSAAPVTAGAGGDYRIVTTDESTQPLAISAPGFLTRETFLRGGSQRSQDIDLIGGELAAYYRQMTHNGWEAPSRVSATPTLRWTQPPNIYVRTTWRDTGAAVANVDFYVTEIRRVIPQLTGGRLAAGTIESGPTDRPLASGWINVVFDHTGNYALLGANPGRVQFGADHRCNYIAVTHELGHAMGYWHSGFSGTIMGGLPGFCHEADFTPNELSVAKAMYARPSGNAEPDRDPNASAPMSLHGLPPVAVSCDRFVR